MEEGDGSSPNTPRIGPRVSTAGGERQPDSGQHRLIEDEVSDILAEDRENSLADEQFYLDVASDSSPFTNRTS